MDTLMRCATKTGESSDFDFTLLYSSPLQDRLFLLGLLMRSSVSCDEKFSSALLNAFSQAVGCSEYPDAVRQACLRKFLKEVASVEVRGVKVDTKAMQACFDSIEKWANSRRQLDSAMKELFSDAISTLVVYVKKLEFVLQIARFAVTHPQVLANREGLLELTPAHFKVLQCCQKRPLNEVLAVLSKACGIAARRAESPSRLPLTDLVASTLATLLRAQNSQSGLAAVVAFLSARSALFTLTQRETLHAAYLSAAKVTQSPIDPVICAQYAKAATVTDYEASQRAKQPTVANKVREFLTYLQTEKRQHYVEVSRVTAEWRAVLVEGSGIVSHKDVPSGVVEQLLALLRTDTRANRTAFWKLVLSCLSDMGFNTVENFRLLRSAVCVSPTPHSARNRRNDV